MHALIYIYRYETCIHVSRCKHTVTCEIMSCDNHIKLSSHSINKHPKIYFFRNIKMPKTQFCVVHTNIDTNILAICPSRTSQISDTTGPISVFALINLLLHWRCIQTVSCDTFLIRKACHDIIRYRSKTI